MTKTRGVECCGASSSGSCFIFMITPIFNGQNAKYLLNTLDKQNLEPDKTNITRLPFQLTRCILHAFQSQALPFCH